MISFNSCIEKGFARKALAPAFSATSRSDVVAMALKTMMGTFADSVAQRIL